MIRSSIVFGSHYAPENRCSFPMPILRISGSYRNMKAGRINAASMNHESEQTSDRRLRIDRKKESEKRRQWNRMSKRKNKTSERWKSAREQPLYPGANHQGVPGKS